MKHIYAVAENKNGWNGQLFPVEILSNGFVKLCDSKTSFPLSFGCELLQEIKRVFQFPKSIKEALLPFC